MTETATHTTDQAVLAAWCAGHDTADIARMLGLSESEVATLVPRLLQRRRADRGMVMFPEAHRALVAAEKRVGVRHTTVASLMRRDGARRSR